MRLRINQSAWMTAVFLAVGMPTAAYAQAVQRPIQDFINAQTATTSWSEPATGNGIVVDYANKVNGGLNLGLPTSFKGKITEQAMEDGRARVHVVLHTTDAYTTANQGGVGFVFGSAAGEIIAGAEPALANSLLTLEFINTASGAPMPNLNNLIFFPAVGQELVKITFEATAKGPLRALFGVPAGTPGMVHTTQRGLYGVDSNGAALTDSFPTERITIKKTGK